MMYSTSTVFDASHHALMLSVEATTVLILSYGVFSAFLNTGKCYLG